jgi:hypothetical protein
MSTKLHVNEAVQCAMAAASTQCAGDHDTNKDAYLVNEAVGDGGPLAAAVPAAPLRFLLG